VAQRADRAYVLKTQELGEADLIVTLLTENSGSVRGVARSARKSRRRFGGALEPLTEVQARWSERAGRDLHRVEALDLVRSHASLQTDPGLQAVCAVLAEVAGHVVREAQPDPKGFRLLGAVLTALDGGLDPWVAIRYFEYWTLRLHGLLPDLGSCSACGRALAGRTGRVVSVGRGILCRDCAHDAGETGKALGAAEAEFLAAAASKPPEAMGTERRVARPGGALEALLKGTLEAFVERPFRAYRHLGLVEPKAASGGRGS
jgi:DNA repair protein RecO (recombination protein O)